MEFMIIDNGTSFISELERLVSEKYTIVQYDDLQKATPNLATVLVLSGGHNHPVLWHDSEYAGEIDLIKTHPGPIIGICLGFQLIAHVYGAHLHLLDQKRQGRVDLRPVIDNSLVKDGEGVGVYESHNWSVQKIPKPLVTLATSSDGIEIFRHETKSIYGLQFHPEKTPGTSGGRIFKRIIAEIEAGL